MNIDILNTKSKDKFVLVEQKEDLKVYHRGKWILSIKHYSDDFTAVLIYSDLDKAASVTIYPELKQVFYTVKGGSFSEESLEFMLNNIRDCKESVRQAKEILKNEYNVIMEK